MVSDRNTPNQASSKSKAEGERWQSDPDTVERHDRGSDEQMSGDDSGAGITNRPLEDERANQGAVPARGESREGAHAGHGDSGREEDQR
jgi:hypothetical protein